MGRSMWNSETLFQVSFDMGTKVVFGVRMTTAFIARVTKLVWSNEKKMSSNFTVTKKKKSID